MSALQRGDEASALSLLEKGNVTIYSLLYREAEGVRTSRPLIFPAIQFVQEQVVQALVGLGICIDSFRSFDDGSLCTPAWDAIIHNNVPSLSLCHRFGANLACLRPNIESPSNATSAVSMAIFLGKPLILDFLLDVVHAERSVRLNPLEVAGLGVLARRGGSPSKPIFGALESRGFNFKGLIKPRGNLSRTDADFLLASARRSGDAGFMRYLVKDLGLVAKAGSLEIIEKNTDSRISPPLCRVDIEKYKCVACDVVGITKVCGDCKMSRYCSTECQSRHWKTGGHKTECGSIQRNEKLVASAGLPSAAGSSGI